MLYFIIWAFKDFDQNIQYKYICEIFGGKSNVIMLIPLVTTFVLYWIVWSNTYFFILIAKLSELEKRNNKTQSHENLELSFAAFCWVILQRDWLIQRWLFANAQH